MLLVKNANHHLSLQQVVVVTSKITGHRAPLTNIRIIIIIMRDTK